MHAKSSDLVRLDRRAFLRGSVITAAVAILAACGGNPDATKSAATTVATASSTSGLSHRRPPLFGLPPAPETFTPPTGTPTTPLLIFTGDSLTYGDHVQRTETYPAQTIALLAPARYDAVNLGMNADRIASLNMRADTTIDPLYAASRSKNIVVLWGGGNDLAVDASADETFARLVTFGQARRRVGFTVVVLTLLPRTGLLGGMSKEEFETRRQGLNASMRQNLAMFADALADVAAAPTFSAVSITANREYFATDETHLIAKGYSIIAPIVKTTILTL